jgi:hypothetical protein
MSHYSLDGRLPQSMAEDVWLAPTAQVIGDVVLGGRRAFGFRRLCAEKRADRDRRPDERAGRLRLAQRSRGRFASRRGWLQFLDAVAAMASLNHGPFAATSALAESRGCSTRATHTIYQSERINGWCVAAPRDVLIWPRQHELMAVESNRLGRIDV